MSRTVPYEGKRKRAASVSMPYKAPKQLYSSARRYSSSVVETKYFDTTFNAAVAAAADWTGTEVACSSYIQGDGTTVGAYTDSALVPSAVGAGYGQVVGSKYLLKKLRVRGELVCSAAADQADIVASRSVRVVLVQDTQPNGQQAQGEEIFTDLGNATQCNYSFLAMAAGSGGRFRILKDELIILQPASAGTDGTNTNSCMNMGAHFSFDYKPSKPISCRIKASSATPTVAALSDNNFFLLAHSSATTPTVSIVGAARAYYID